MSSIQPSTGHSTQKEHKYPTSHIVGYLLSIVLTVIAFVMVMHHMLPFYALLLVILVLAALQIVVQLIFFMHVTERHGPSYHLMTFGVALVFVFVIVAASMWIMTFNAQVS